MENKYFNISEKFYSIQGEGITIGSPSIFIRLTGCNILCKGSGWICDSIEVWKKGTKTNFEDVLSINEINLLKLGTHLIITGGEPMLYQMKIIDFIEWFESNFDFIPFIEIETNGTIIPNKKIINYVSQWNVSPKLSNSGVAEHKRINPKALAEYNSIKNCIFKFVISKETDVIELSEKYLPINYKKIYLMPAGATQEELNKTRLIVVEQCKAYGFRYSERLHIVIWNKKTGV
jgi:7-carboxy-7-deazaguanine synthase